jgi:plasmid stabilization system protein ParE
VKPIRCSQRALQQLHLILSWLESLAGANPKSTLRRIEEAAQLLERLGDIGRPGRAAGTKELPVRLAPSVLAYVNRSDVPIILGMYHMRQRR